MDEVFELQSPEWLIDGLIRRGQVMFLNGQPKTGKSLFALRVAAAVTSGSPLWGHEVKQGRVWYIAAERAYSFKERLQGIESANIPFVRENMTMYPQPVAFLNSEDVMQFAEICGPTDLIIIDTLRRCFAGGRENDNNDMTFWVSGVERLCEETGAAAMVIHHNQRPTRDARGRTYNGDWAGGGALLGSVDAQLKLEREEQSGLVKIATAESNDLTTFIALGVIRGYHIGDTKTAGVMIEANIPNSSREEPSSSLKDLVSEVLRDRGELTIKDIWTTVKQHPDANPNWKLDKSTISRVVSELENVGTVKRIPNPSDGRSSLISLGN